jgi:hypothetical protein
MSVLEQRFGLSEEEQKSYLDDYRGSLITRWKRLDQERSQWLAR